MAVSTVFRQLFAVVFGLFAWWYYYTVEPITTYPHWAGIILAAFLISLVMAIISENLTLGIVTILAVYLFFGPGLMLSFNQLLPLIGGTAAASAFWKII